MGTLTAQEFALYLGQDIQYPEIDDTLLTATLTGVSSEGLETTYKDPKAGEPDGDILAFHSNGHHNSDALHAKLLLRPLTDLTKEEAHQVAIEAGYTHGILGNKTAMQNMGFRYIRHIETDNWESKSPQKLIQVFAYLLKQGFDVMGFIAAGKAIDKTKL